MAVSHILPSASGALAMPLRALGTVVEMQLRTELWVGGCCTPGKCALKDRYPGMAQGDGAGGGEEGVSVSICCDCITMSLLHVLY